MTAPINKILATTSQAFTTAQQAQARTNIDAQKSIAYSYSGSTITGIDGSAVGKINSYGYSGDTITSIDGSAVGKINSYGYSGTTITSIDGSAVGLSTASADNGITGNGSPEQPLGVSSSLTFSDSLAKASISPSTLRMSGNSSTAILNAGTFGILNSSQESVYVYPTAMWFTDSAHNTAEVTKGSIDRWNGYSASGWAESSNPLSVGYGGNQVSAASQYNVGQGNWAARTVKASGIPDMNLYGFRNLPVGQGTFGVNGNGAWIDLKPETRWESSFQASSKTYDLLNIPKNATAFINVQGHFDSCSYVNMTTSNDAWLSVNGGSTTAGGGFRTWPLTNITTVAKGGTADEGYTPHLQVVTTGNTKVWFTVNMVIKEE